MKLLLIILCALCLAYFFLDRQLYFFGKNDLDIYHPLPVKVEPEFWGYDKGNLGFVFIDEFDFTVVANGNRYKSSEVVVNEIIKYGFDEEKIIVFVNDSSGVEHVLKCQDIDDSKIDVSVDSTTDYGELSWIEIKGSDGYVRKMELVRNYSQIAFVILIFVAGYMMVKRRMRVSS